jgi:hypothetical protein
MSCDGGSHTRHEPRDGYPKAPARVDGTFLEHLAIRRRSLLMLVLLGGVLGIFHILGGVLSSVGHFFHVLSDTPIF